MKYFRKNTVQLSSSLNVARSHTWYARDKRRKKTYFSRDQTIDRAYDHENVLAYSLPEPGFRESKHELSQSRNLLKLGN